MRLESLGGHLHGRQDIHRSAVLIGVGFHVISSPQVPSAFRNALWLLAPPKKLEPGQHDLLHEAEAGCILFVILILLVETGHGVK